MSQVKIIPGTEADIPDVLYFIKQLAIYEKLEHEAVATPELLKKNLFGDERFAEVIFILEDDVKVGFALFFKNFSTFLGMPGIYLEDLFVLPKARGKGYGKKLLSHIAKLAIDRGYGRFEWSVLDWNTPAIDFYRSLGAVAMDEWTVQRMTGDSLRKLAALNNS